MSAVAPETYPATISPGQGEQFDDPHAYYVTSFNSYWSACSERIIHRYQNRLYTILPWFFNDGSASIAMFRSDDDGVTWFMKPASIEQALVDSLDSTHGFGVHWDDVNGKAWVVCHYQALEINSFDFATDTWDAATATGGPTGGTITAVLGGGIGTFSSTAMMNIARQSNGRFVIIYHKEDSANLYLVTWKLSDGWSTPVFPFANPTGNYGGQPGFDPAVDDVQEDSLGICVMPDGRVHILELNNWLSGVLGFPVASPPGWALWQVSMDLAGNLSEPAVLNQGYWLEGDGAPPSSFPKPVGGNVGLTYIRTLDSTGSRLSTIERDLMYMEFTNAAVPVTVDDSLVVPYWKLYDSTNPTFYQSSFSGIGVNIDQDYFGRGFDLVSLSTGPCIIARIGNLKTSHFDHGIAVIAKSGSSWDVAAELIFSPRQYIDCLFAEEVGTGAIGIVAAWSTDLADPDSQSDIYNRYFQFSLSGDVPPVPPGPPAGPCDAAIDNVQPLTDNQFELQRVVATMRIAKHLPVRGSAR